MLILKMLYLLLVSYHPNVVLVLCIFHLGVVVAYLGFEFFDIFTGVVIEVMNHVLLDLEHVALDLGFVELFFEVLDCHFELRTKHGHVVVFWLNFGLSTLLALLSLSFFTFASHI